MAGPLISAGELADAVASARPPRLLDVRWRLDRPDGGPAYREGHLPGAVYVALDEELAAHGLPATDGRHPLPAVGDLQAAARRWGLRTGDAVVVYDDLGGMSAARAWWLLRHAGVEDVRVLDGGLAAWTGPLEQGDVVPEPGEVELVYGSMPVLTADEAAALPASGTLLDARAGERYRGETEPVDPRAGHIPGALSAPTAANLADGRVRDPEELRSGFAESGVRLDAPIGVYCGSGVTAAHEVLVLETLGVAAALYPGSWSAWSNDLDRPVAVGADPG